MKVGEPMTTAVFNNTMIFFPDTDETHRTLGNCYAVLLNARGDPVKHRGDPAARFGIDQTGAIK